jgi:hypothetical protein
MHSNTHDVRGEFKTFEAYSVRKARQKYAKNDGKAICAIVGERFHVVISSTIGDS